MTPTLGQQLAPSVTQSAPIKAPTLGQRLAPLVTPKGFVESVREDWPQKLPILGLPLTIKGALDDSDRVARAMEGDEQAALELSEWMLEARRKRTVGGWIGAIGSELPAYAAEFALAGGLASATVKGGGAVAKKAVGEAVEGAIERTVSKMGRTRLGAIAAKLPGATTRAAVQTALMPSTYAEVLRRGLPPGMDLVLDPQNAKRAAIVFVGAQREFAEALPDGVLSSFIEVVSERSGALIPTHYLGALQGAVMRRWLKRNPSKTVEDFLRKIQYGAQWHGPINEFAEERLAAAGKAAAGLDPWSEVFPEAEQMLGEFAAFSIAQGGMSAASMLGSRPASPEEAAQAQEQAFQEAPAEAAQEPAGSTQPEEAPEVAPEAEPQAQAEPEVAPEPEAQVLPEPVEEPTPVEVYDEPEAPPADPVPTVEEEAAVAAGPAPRMSFGAETEMLLSDGRVLPARYALIEIGDLLTSHYPARGFAIRPGGDPNVRPYHDATNGLHLRQLVRETAQNPRPMGFLADSPIPTVGPPQVTEAGVVLGGNRRGMAQELIYAAGGQHADLMRRETLKQARALGIDTEGFENPVLVRVIPPEHQGAPGELSRILNESPAAASTPATDAVGRGRHINQDVATKVAEILGDGTLREALNDKKAATELIGAMVEAGAATEGDVTNWLEPSGLPTPAAKSTIEYALLGSVIPDVRTLVETQPTIRNKILSALPSLIAIKSLWPEFAGHLSNALDAVKAVQQEGLALEDSVRQVTIIPQPWKEDGSAVRIAGSLLYRDTKTFKASLFVLAELLRDEAEGQADLFATPIERTPAGMVASAFGAIGAKEPRRPSALGRASAVPADLASQALPMSMPSVLEEDGDAIQRDPTLVQIEPTIYGTLERAAGVKGVVLKPHINKALRRVLAEAGGELVPILVTPGLGRNVLGHFVIRTRMIGLRRHSDIATAAHEVGHAFAELLFGDVFLERFRSDFAPPAKEAQEELVALGRQLYPEKQPLWYAEGWAEFMRTWLTQPERLSEVAPTAAKWFQQSFLAQLPRVSRALDDARTLITNYRLQGSEARSEGSQIRVTKLRGAWEGLKRMVTARALLRAHISAGAELWAMERTARKVQQGIAKIPGHKDAPGVPRRLRYLDPEANELLPSNLAKSFRATAGPTVLTMVEDAMVDSASREVGPSLLKVLDKLSRRGAAVFSRYLQAQQTRAEYGDFAPAQEARPAAEHRPRETGMSIVDARKLVEQWEKEAPELSEVADGFYQWWAGIQNYAAQISQNAREVFRRIRAHNVRLTGEEHGYYASLTRVFEEEETDWYGWLKRGRTQSRSPGVARRRKGSGRPVKPVVENMVANAVMTLASAQKAAVVEASIKLSKHYEGLAGYMHEVTPEDEPVARENLTSILARIADVLEDVRPQAAEALLGIHEELTQAAVIRGLRRDQAKADKAADDAKSAEIEAQIENILSEVEDVVGLELTFFAPPKEVRGGWYILSHWDPFARRLRHYRMTRGMYEAIGSIDVYRLPLWADMLLRVPKDLYRAGATGMRASFGLMTNMQLDLPTVAVQTRTSGSGMYLFFNYWRSFGEAFVAAATGGLVKSEALRLFDRMGLGGQTRWNEDTRWVERAQNRVLAGRRVMTIPPSELPRFVKGLAVGGYHYIRELIGTFEKAGRLAEVRTLGAQRVEGWKPGDQMSFRMTSGLRVAGKQVSGDFTELGTVSRVMTQIFPFYGATIAGPREFVRAVGRDPAKALSRGMLLTVAAIAYWYMRRDEEWFQEATDEEKFLYAMFPTGDKPDDPIVRWRMPHEIGYLFFSTPLMLLDSWYRHDPETAGDWAKTLLEGGGKSAKLMLSYSVPDVTNAPAVSTVVEQVANYDFDRGAPIVSSSMQLQNLPPEQQIGPYTTRASAVVAEWAAKRGVYLSPVRLDHIMRSLTASAATDVLKAVGLGPGSGRFEELGVKPEDRYIVGQIFRPGGASGVRSKSVEEFYDSFARLERMEKRGELDGEKQALMRSMRKAREALGFLGFLRSWAKDRDEQAAYFREMQEIARQANADMHAVDPSNIGRFMRDAKLAERKRELRRRELEEQGRVPPRRR